MNRNREMVNRYIYAVRCWLPPKQKDAALELHEDLLGQIEDREAEFGRPLAAAEVAEILKRCGHPLIVASRYLPEESNVDRRSATRLVLLWTVPMAAILVAVWLVQIALGAWFVPLTIALIFSAAMFAAGFFVSLKFLSRPAGSQRPRLKEML